MSAPTLIYDLTTDGLNMSSYGIRVTVVGFALIATFLMIPVLVVVHPARAKADRSPGSISPRGSLLRRSLLPLLVGSTLAAPVIAAGSIVSARMDTLKSLTARGRYVSVRGALDKVKANWNPIYGKHTIIGYEEYDDFVVPEAAQSFEISCFQHEKPAVWEQQYKCLHAESGDKLTIDIERGVGLDGTPRVLRIWKNPEP